MGSLHNVTQLHPFVLSGDGAFLPISSGAESEFTRVFEKQVSRNSGLNLIPAAIQDVNGYLDIHGMHTTRREHQVDAIGMYLHIQPGGKHGYGSELSELVEVSSPYLDDFWFFVLWNNQYANEFSKSNGSTLILETQKLPSNDYSQFITSKLQDDPSIACCYLVESGLWAKRCHEADLEEYGPQDTVSLVDHFPDAIELLKQSLELNPECSEAIAAIEWYERNLDRNPKNSSLPENPRTG